MYAMNMTGSQVRCWFLDVISVLSLGTENGGIFMVMFAPPTRARLPLHDLVSLA